MKDEINGSVYGGAKRRLVRGSQVSVQQAAGGSRPRATPPRRSSLVPLRGCGSKATAAALYNLWDVYTVISRWPACDRSLTEQYAYDLALNRLLARIEKSGPDAVGFDSERSVYAYAEQIRNTTKIDAARHMEMKQRVLQDILYCGGHRINGVPSSYSRFQVDLSIDVEAGLREESEWLHARLDADSAELVQSVYIDDVSVAEIARESKVPESTIRSRLGRAMDILRASVEAEAGDRIRTSNN